MIRSMATVLCVLGMVAAAAQAAPIMPNADGLKAYYLFDEAVSDGSIVLDGKGSNNGTAVGDTIASTTTTPFTYANNKAVSFNAGSGSMMADDDYVQIPMSSALDLKSNTGTYSISLWFKTTTTTKSNLVARAVSNAQYQILAQSTGGVKATIGNSSNGATTGTYNDGSWHNVVVSMSAGTGKLYVDGLEGVTITPNGTNINVSVDTLIGAKRPGTANTGSSDAYTGLIDDVAFFNYALSADEAAWLGNSQNGGIHAMVTPEPATLCLLALGGVFMVRGRRH